MRSGAEVDGRQGVAILVSALLVLLECPEMECPAFVDCDGYPNPADHRPGIGAKHMNHLRQHVRERLEARRREGA